MPLAGEDRVKLQSLQDFVGPELVAFEHEYNQHLTGDLPLLREICDHLRQGKSKRFRPTLLMITAKNGNQTPPEVVFAATCVEIVHTATLIHDDFIDEAELRRQLPTINVKWGPSAALIMGDFLYSKVFSLLTSRGMDETMRILARTTHRMSVAEMMQLEGNRQLDLSEDEYLTIIREKTASLIGAACEIGALLSPGMVEHRERFAEFGTNVGLAFQITDDIFDYRGDAKRLGKPIGSDWREGRITLPFIFAMRNAPQREIQRIEEGIAEGQNGLEQWNEVCDFVQRHGGLDYSYQLACKFGRLAKEGLRQVGPIRQTSVLSDAVDYVLSRLH